MMSTNSEPASHLLPSVSGGSILSFSRQSSESPLPAGSTSSLLAQQSQPLELGLESGKLHALTVDSSEHTHRDDGCASLDDHEDDNDNRSDDDSEGKWYRLRSSVCSAGHGSSERLLARNDGDRDRVQACIEDCWIPNIIYENVANIQPQILNGGCGYGKLRRCEENIYENICEDCGRLYSADKCAFCAVEDEIEADRTKKANKYSAKFQEFFGNFWTKPVRFGGSGSIAATGTIHGKRKLCKSDIVHNVNGFEDVFRTNKSFDLGEICRMRNDARSSELIVAVTASSPPQQPSSVGAERVPRHKSEDHLASSVALESTAEVSRAVLPQSTTTTTAETKDSGCQRLKVRSASENLIDFSTPERRNETIYENLLAPNRPESGGCDGLLQTPPAVSEWMMSLLVETEDYADDFEATYHVKSIPSVTFNDVSVVSCWSTVINGRKWFNCGNEQDISYKIEEFRQNVRNNRCNQRCESERGELCDPVIISFRNSIFENENTDQSKPKNVAGDKPEESAIGLLNVFDTVHYLGEARDDACQNITVADTGGGAVNDVIRPYRSQVYGHGCTRTVVERLSPGKQYSARDDSKKRLLIRKHLLAISLCRVVISYERRLKVFWLVAAFQKVAQQQRSLVLNKHRTYIRIMADECQPVASTLRESIEIDKYFRFLESNEVMINLAAAKRRRRRRGELINPELQSNSSNEISCSSTTSGVHSDCGIGPLDEHIYQRVWTCRTEGAEQVYESPQEHIYEYIKRNSTVKPRDEHEWLVVDDFSFSKSNRRIHRPAPPIPNRNVRHPLDRYKNVCILYNPVEPKNNRIVYDYRRDYIFDYRSLTKDDVPSATDSGASSSGEEDEEDDELEFCDSYPESEDDDGDTAGAHYSTVDSRESRGKYSCYAIPDCVQYWKFMLLNVNYNDDEEDVVMTETTLAVIEENTDKCPPTPGDQSPKVITQTPSSPSVLSPPGNPAALRINGKSQIPTADSCPGTYKSKSTENLPDVTPQEKEKSPSAGKREWLRDKVKAVLPLSSSRHPEEGLVFGVELDHVERDEKLQIPRFLFEVTEILKEHEYINTSGLYRASGNKNSIENIKKKLNEKRSPKKYEFLKKQDVHSLTGSLKLFFRELKSPLISRDVYEQCVLKTKDEAEAIDNIKLGLVKMETIHRNTLKYLIRHLKLVHQHSDVNMMNSSNLAIVFGACLFASTLGLMESYENNDLGKINTLVKQLIDHYDKIFYEQ
ncbi:uncharacterized protein LOC129732254 [Wyeomyia smithii]|uniref:uncharacterized protein LOC129732254 n=1 Tax=Wyeomyia smithii TaxID=174621 RepID=UPI002467B730|nr:uncharacterized protein LOC129732254 [Wyeomyia smithii]XP_055548941.1 uncharacterized protein LOC129732254 [Wyeomyia smithii]XP_055548951.1 uncharacterized protein LOC129732254 [Wyeomyia smithii]